MNAEKHMGIFARKRLGVAVALVATAALVTCLGVSGCAQSLGEASSSSSEAAGSAQPGTVGEKVGGSSQGLSASSSESSEATSSAEAAGGQGSDSSEASGASTAAGESQAEQSGTHPVCLSLSAPGYSNSDGKIPVTVNGTSKEGAFVDLVCYVGSDGSGIELAPGSYTITVIESPLLSGARFYTIPTDSIKVDVPEGLGEGEAVNASGQLVFSKRKAKGLTSDVIDTAYQYAVSGGLDQATAEKYKADLMVAAGF